MWKIFRKPRFRDSVIPRSAPSSRSERGGFRDRGAALITVLLFVVLMFILITAMLSVTGNEVVIAGLQRDGIKATELAQAGLQEAISRVMAGRSYSGVDGWTSSIDPRVRVTVTRVFPGVNSAYLQIDSVASGIGRATRHLTALVLQQVTAFPPNVTFAASVTEQGSADIACGDAYSQTFLQYKNYPSNGCAPPQTLTYTGWRVSKVDPDKVNACYRGRPWIPGSGADCTSANPTKPNVHNWYPGTRVTTGQTSSLGQDILTFQANADPTYPSCQPTSAAYTGTLPANAILQNELGGAGLKTYGYDTDVPPMVAGPASAPTAAPGSGTGLTGTYTVVVTWWSASGESYGSPPSAAVTVTNKEINVSGIPAGPAGTTARGIYAFKSLSSGSYQLAGVIADNTTTTFTITTDVTSWSTPLPTSNVSQLDPDYLPCGLPYKWVPLDFPNITDESGGVLSGGDVAGRRWFKTIVFEQWFQNYWWFNENALTVVKRGNGNGTQPCVGDLLDPDGTICVKANVADVAPSVQPDLVQYPQFGAVPPFPDMSSVTSNYDCSKSGSGVLNSLPTACTKPDGTPTTSDLGCKNPEMGGCGTSRQVAFELNGDWTINGNLGGYGTIVVNGNLVVNGTFTYYGTIIVNGTLQAGTGNVNVYGGLVALDTLRLIGNITVNGGTTVGAAGVPTGTSIVFGKAWFER